MLPEAAVDVVVLAMDVRGDRPADGHVARPRCHGYEETEGKQQPHELIEARTSLDVHLRPFDVHAENAVARRHVEHDTPGVLSGVAVAPPEPAGEHAALGRLRDQPTHGIVGGDGNDRRNCRAGAPPTGQRATTPHISSSTKHSTPKHDDPRRRV
ncbi:hypothetical protein GALL_317100 [mine drainage metagenome]|uniref:Uncharacterized protein n=1 Tax=mine drainage metagenome TaxID=410659 RepID=A0A1J5R313_9ZZZZ